MEQRYATMTVLAEDERARNLLRRYAERAFDVTGRRLITVPAPPGKGDAKQWVLERYAVEVQLYRRGLSYRGLIVHLDLDTSTIGDRQRDLAQALKVHGMHSREPQERIAHVLCGRHVETWIASLTGQHVTPDGTELDETYDCKRNRFPRNPDQLLRQSVEELYSLTRPNAAMPQLPSLSHAVTELRRL